MEHALFSILKGAFYLVLCYNKFVYTHAKELGKIKLEIM